MTKVHWLVEDGPFEEDLNPIIDEIKRQGHPLTITKYSPSESGNYGNLFPEDACVVFYGSLNLAHQLQRQTPWIPGPMANFDNYDMLHLHAHYHGDVINCGAIFQPWGLAYHNLELYINSSLRNPRTYFIRPNNGNKSFSGQLVNKTSDLAYIDSRIKPHDLVMYDIPVHIHEEYRLIVADRKIIAGSQYKKNNEIEVTLNPNVPDYVLKYAQENILDDMACVEETAWFPNRMFVMDVGVWGDSKTVGIVEFNPICCSGWYACDPEPIVREMSRIALEEYNMIVNWDNSEEWIEDWK